MSYETRVTRKKLAVRVAERTPNVNAGMVNEVLIAFIEVVGESLIRGEVISLTGLGVLRKIKRSARTVKSPITGHEVDVPEHFGISFKPSPSLKKIVR